MQKITKVGIVGRGEFARLIEHHMPSGVSVVSFDKGSDFTGVAECDVLFLGVPVQAYGEVLKIIKEYLSAQTLLVDVCSVKLASQKLIKAILPSHKNILISHPMFGPQTALISLEGKELVVCEELGSATKFVKLLEGIFKLKVVRMTADEHDRTMAQVHGLTLFLARGVSAFGVEKQKIHAPSFDWILGLAELDSHHSDALMETIEVYNPYAAAARTKILKHLADIDASYIET